VVVRRCIGKCKVRGMCVQCWQNMWVWKLVAAATNVVVVRKFFVCSFLIASKMAWLLDSHLFVHKIPPSFSVRSAAISSSGRRMSRWHSVGSVAIIRSTSSGGSSSQISQTHLEGLIAQRRSTQRVKAPILVPIGG
jgi:hypothetical protein